MMGTTSNVVDTSNVDKLFEDENKNNNMNGSENDNNKSYISTSNNTDQKIRGVTVDGWLVPNLSITPYLFLVTNCHLDGKFCKYPEEQQHYLAAGNSNSNTAELCDLYHCKAPAKEGYPYNIKDLVNLFGEKRYDTLEKYLNLHYNTFITKDDLIALNSNNSNTIKITHLKVSMPNFILSDSIMYNSISGNSWMYFIRFINWCRDLKLKVWVEIQYPLVEAEEEDSSNSCPLDDDDGSIDDELLNIKEIANQILYDGLSDVVTGFGVLGYSSTTAKKIPSGSTDGCSPDLLKEYFERSKAIIYDVLGKSIEHVYISRNSIDTIQNKNQVGSEPSNANDLHIHSNNYMYHSYNAKLRHLSPRQHIAYACTQSLLKQKGEKITTMQQQQDHFSVFEFTSSFDTEPFIYAKDKIMTSIVEKTNNNNNNRESTNALQQRRSFLHNFVLANMYLSESTGDGWFYHNIKVITSDPYLAEYDFLKASSYSSGSIGMGWMPTSLPNGSSEATIEKSCEGLISETSDDFESIVHEYPPYITNGSNRDKSNNIDDDYITVDDDIVVSHGETLIDNNDNDVKYDPSRVGNTVPATVSSSSNGTAKAEKSQTSPSAASTSEVSPSDPWSHAESSTSSSIVASSYAQQHHHQQQQQHSSSSIHLFPLIAVGFLAYAIKRVFFNSQRDQYTHDNSYDELHLQRNTSSSNRSYNHGVEIQQLIV